MAKDFQKDNLTKIENWCVKNEISIFYGEIIENNTTEINWIKSDESDWEKYLNVLKRSENKLLTITVCKNEFEETDDVISDYVDSLDDEEKGEYNEALQTIKRTKGQVAYFILTFFQNNVSYQYQEESEWIDEYRMIDEVDFDEGDDEFENTEDQLTEKEIEEAARKIIADTVYIEAKDKFQRKEIANTLMERNGIENFINTYEVRLKAEEIFLAEVKPKQEAELRRQILELKAIGDKKVEIASKLKISRDTVNKHYYSENT